MIHVLLHDNTNAARHTHTGQTPRRNSTENNRVWYHNTSSLVDADGGQVSIKKREIEIRDRLEVWVPV